MGRHTQLDGAVIASTATADKTASIPGRSASAIFTTKRISNSALGYQHQRSGQLRGPVQGHMPGGMISAAGNSGHAEGTTRPPWLMAPSPSATKTTRSRTGEPKPRHRTCQRQHQPDLRQEKEQNRLKEIGMISDIGGQWRILPGRRES